MDREWIALILMGLLFTVNLFTSWKFFGTSVQLYISCKCWRLSEVWVGITLTCLWSPAGSAQHIDSQTRKRVMSHSIFLCQPERQVTNNLSFRRYGMCSVAWIYIFFNLTSRDPFMSQPFFQSLSRIACSTMHYISLYHWSLWWKVRSRVGLTGN